jgi:hypothetical protein
VSFTLGFCTSMNLRRQIQIATGVLLPTVFGWVLYCAAACVVRNDSINYRIADAGLRFISTAAEEVFAAGPVVSAGAGLVSGLPTLLLCVRGVGPLLRCASLNFIAVLLLLCGMGSMNGTFAASAGLGTLVWIIVLFWAVTCLPSPAQLGAAPNGGPAERLGNSGVGGGPPSVS